ncbi:hypothetical protein MLDJOKPK_00248 [Salmonella phage SPAsTU]|nr:hypothetical protein STsAS_163 [Salmonella phage STsAS]AWN09147.1 hypothetical protein MLDJOKPK_00248 [Salmonella phage SPAsTU]
MAEIVILSSSSDLTDAQNKQLLALHYKFLNHQRNVLQIEKGEVPMLSIEKLLAGNRAAIALEGDTPVGYCLYRVISGVLKFRSMYVSEMARRRKVMTQLFDVLKTREEFSSAYGGIYAAQESGVAFFTARGFNKTVSPDGQWLEFTKLVQTNVETADAVGAEVA